MKVNRLIILILALAYAVFWFGGIFSYVYLDEPPSDSRWAAPVFLYLAGILIMALTEPGYRLQLAACGFLGLAAEMIGVRLGFPFGSYSYTNALKPMVLGVPLAIGFAWLILFAYIKQMLQGFDLKTPWFQFCGALWMMGLDLVIDPLASGPLNYWIWENQGWFSGVPTVNFLGWFGVSLVMFFIFSKPWPRSNFIGYIGLSIVLFFTLISLAHGIYPALIAGVALILIHFGLMFKRQGGKYKFIS
jgi:putative membrane protein